MKIQFSEVFCKNVNTNRKISVSVLITNEATLKLIERVNTTGADNRNNTTNSYAPSSFDCLIKTPSTSTLSCQSNACYPASPSHLLFQRHLNTSLHLQPLWLYWGFFFSSLLLISLNPSGSQVKENELKKDMNLGFAYIRCRSSLTWLFHHQTKTNDGR